MLFNYRQCFCTVMQWLVLMVWVTQALAGQVQLAWDAPDSSTPPAGYMLYYWQEPTGVPQSVDMGPQTTYALDGLVNGATYSFAVTEYDTAGNESGESNIVTVTMPSDDSLPVALPDTASTPAGTPVTIAVLANDNDPAGYPFTITAVAQGASGSVISDGTTVTYTPAATFGGTDSFTYTITDSAGAAATATVTVTVTVTVFAIIPLDAASGTLAAPMTVSTDPALPTLQYVWVPESAGNVEDVVQASGEARYTFTVPTTDSYVIWGRVSPSTTGTGSFFLGLDVPGASGSNGVLTDVAPTTYQVATLHVGDTYYVDRAYTITALPPELDGLVAIKTAQANRGNQQDTFLTGTLLQDATLYVAYDAQAATFPSWLTQFFTNTGQLIQTTRGPLAVWQQEVAAGPLALPGNKYEEPDTVRAQYVVFLAFHAPPPYLVWNVTPPLGPSSLPQPWGWDQAASDTTPVFFLNAGVHTLTIRQRDSGTKLDKLVITNDVNWMPQE
jgi:Bacterial Ig domain/Fibronectin type III domain